MKVKSLIKQILGISDDMGKSSIPVSRQRRCKCNSPAHGWADLDLELRTPAETWEHHSTPTDGASTTTGRDSQLQISPILIENSQPWHTHSDSSRYKTSTYGPRAESPETIIKFTHKDESAWDTEMEESTTSTPDFKRGRHSEQNPISDEEAVRAIKREGLVMESPVWIQDRSRRMRASVLVLADSQLKFWPGNDKICRIAFHPR